MPTLPRRWLFAVILMLLTRSVAVAAERKHGEFADEKIGVDGTDRVYRLVVPKSVDLDEPVPLVIAFHGIRIDNKDLMPKYSMLNETAEKHNFIITYPNGIDQSWGLRPEKVKKDLAFFDALVKAIQDKYAIDSNQIYVVGMSNGAYFAHLIGKEGSASVAAVVAHSGAIGLGARRGIRADRKFPVMIIHGDSDQLLNVRQAQESRDKYKAEGHDVEYIEIPGLGHKWATESDINEKIWKFLSEHPLKK